MNKNRRHELKMLHFKRRMKKYGLPPGRTWHALRSHGTPCSCGICRGEKYSRAKEKKALGKELIPEESLAVDRWPLAEESV
jgi:hypothetical protein